MTVTNTQPLKLGLAAVYVRDETTRRRRATLNAHPNVFGLPRQAQDAFLRWLAHNPSTGCPCPTCHDQGVPTQ